MVKWLLQNSLVRSYHEIYPDSTLPAIWEYYVKPDRLDTSTTFTFASLTLLDPCMGSGHFLREAFDMFVAMYREQFHTLSATEIADRILSHHLYGIDIDPRAAQLSALTLYLRAWELVRDERRKERKPGPGTYTPPAMNLATTPTSLTEGALQRHLRRHPQDMPMKPLLEGIFAGLEQADILGSLLRPKEYLDHAIAELQRPHTIRIDFDPAEAELRHTITEMANRDPAGLRQMLLERIADSFKAEAGNTDDVSAALFGREAEQGVRLLQLLDRSYAVVVTNPPYMGSKNMETLLKKYVEKYYPAGKRDLYAAFILRCLELCRPDGRVAMVTMQSWMFLRSFAELRVMPEAKLREIRKPGTFTGLLRETSIVALAHLGPNAFEEISREVVQSAMMILTNRKPRNEHRMIAFRLTGLRSPQGKSASLLRRGYSEAGKIITNPLQNSFLEIPESPIVYYLGEELLACLIENQRLQDVADVRQGLATADDNRFLRYTWEILNTSLRWPTITKGGGYCKWFGLNWYHVDWEYAGARLKAFSRSVLRNVDAYFHSGWSYSRICRGSASLRHFDTPGCIGDKGPGIYTDEESIPAILQSHVLSFMLRAISPQLAFEVNTIMQTPLPGGENKLLSVLAQLSEMYKRFLISGVITERTFADTISTVEEYRIAGRLHSMEGAIEQVVCQAYDLSADTIQTIISGTGTPAGWYPLIAGYHTLPLLPADLDLPPLSQELFDYLETHERIRPDEKELVRIKANLRTLYEAGPGTKSVEQEATDEATEDDAGEEEIASGAHISIPTETFLEELSVKMQLHPISIYWLLEELRAEGVRCKPEEQRLLEDRLSVLVLRLLGHRWPKQIEADEPVPDWADRDGIIPLVPGTGKATLAEQVRARLRAEDGELGTQQTEALLAELMNMSLEEWVRRFFPRHVSQFKYRTIAWHLVSTPVNNGKKKRGGAQRGPAFECLLYYHACMGDALARIRTQYVVPLIRAECQRMEDASLYTDETVTVLAHDRIRELEAFVEKLRLAEERGFACPELDKIIAEEPLDRWSGDGYLPPTSRDELLRNEQAWHVDINDGVRVNIAPLQLAGALVGDVLKAADAKKALADRARWRADERHWVRDGKLPRCGWMDEQVPESPRWTEREPERVAGQIRLEQKRLALEHKRAEEVEL